jgi:hypothetical protein
MSNNENIKLFGSLELESPETLNVLIDNLDKEQAVFMLTESVKYAHRKGVFTILEAEIISKSIRKIYEIKPLENNN